MPISCVALFVFFVPILLYHLPGSHSPTLGFFSPLFMGLTKAFGCQGVPFGYPPRHIPISLRYVVSGPRARSDWFAGAVQLIRRRDALTISDIGTTSFVTCLSAERSAFPLSAVPFRCAQCLSAEPHVASNVRYIAFSLDMGPYLYLAFNENELLTHT